MIIQSPCCSALIQIISLEKSRRLLQVIVLVLLLHQRNYAIAAVRQAGLGATARLTLTLTGGVSRINKQ